jgi:hypothetical protein
MSGFVGWIAAQADGRDDEVDGLTTNRPREPLADMPSATESSSRTASWHEFPGHNFPGRLPAPPDEARLQDDPLDRNPDLWLYRSRTVALLRRYLRFSLETGRLPSLVGREFFRARMTAYTATTFEDRVIFVRDVEKSLDRLEYWDQQLIARIILQEHGHEQAARILHCNRKTIQRRLPQVLDLLSEDFLSVGLLAALPAKGGLSR